MAYETLRATAVLGLALALGACAQEGAPQNGEAGPTGEPRPAATCEVPDRGDPMPTVDPDCYPVDPDPTETPADETSDEPLVLPSQRYTPPTDPTCKPLGLTPENVADTPDADGYEATNGEDCVYLLDPVTGKKIGVIAAGEVFDISCVNFRPYSVRVKTHDELTGETVISDGTEALFDEGALPVPAC